MRGVQTILFLVVLGTMVAAFAAGSGFRLRPCW